MKNLVLVRIDDRLIHGQIVTQWLKSTHGNKILIIDDDVPNNPMIIRILKAAAPPDVKVVIKSVTEGIEYCKKEKKTDDEQIVLLVKTPEVIEKLLDDGVPIPKVILGGMGFKAGRSRINRNISANQEEIDCMKRILDKGTEIWYQLVPAEVAQNFEKNIRGGN